MQFKSDGNNVDRITKRSRMRQKIEYKMALVGMDKDKSTSLSDVNDRGEETDIITFQMSDIIECMVDINEIFFSHDMDLRMKDLRNLIIQAYPNKAKIHSDNRFMELTLVLMITLGMAKPFRHIKNPHSDLHEGLTTFQTTYWEAPTTTT